MTEELDKIKPNPSVEILENPTGDQDSRDAALMAAKDRHDHSAENLKGLEQDREQRKEYTGKIFRLVCWWFGGLANIIIWSQWLKISDNVLIALISGTSVNIIGLMIIVIKYLFPKKG